MADDRRNARLKGTIQAVQRTKIRTERMNHAAATAKEKLDHTTQQNEQDVNEQVSDQVHTYASATRTAVRRTVYDARRIRQKAARVKAKRASAHYRAAEPHEEPIRPSAASRNHAEYPAVRMSTWPIAESNPVTKPTSRSTTAAASKPFSSAVKPAEIMRRKQIQSEGYFRTNPKARGSCRALCI